MKGSVTSIVLPEISSRTSRTNSRSPVASGGSRVPTIRESLPSEVGLITEGATSTTFVPSGLRTM